MPRGTIRIAERALSAAAPLDLSGCRLTTRTRCDLIAPRGLDCRREAGFLSPEECVVRVWSRQLLVEALAGSRPARSALAATAIAGVLLGPVASGPAASREVMPERPAFELPYLRTANSVTFSQADGSLKTSIYSVPIHYKDDNQSWRPIKSKLVASERSGYRWRNEEAGFQAELRDAAQEGLLRFAVGGQAFTLSRVCQILCVSSCGCH